MSSLVEVELQKSSMKTSQFTVFIERAESVIIYNTLWNSFLITDRLHANLLQRGSCKEEDYVNRSVFKAFRDKKMIVDDTVDEMARIRQTLERTNEDHAHFTLVVNPTLACNFNCWYCYESHQDSATMDGVDIEAIVTLVRQIAARDAIKHFDLMFFGGEPLLCYEKVIKPILEAVSLLMMEHEIDFSASITTNGLLLSKERLTFLENHGVKSMQITIDGNKERHNSVRYTKRGSDSYSLIIKNIHDALACGIKVSVRLNISKETNLVARELLNDFGDLTEKQRGYLAFSVHKVWQEEQSLHTIVEQIVAEIRGQGYRCASYFSAPSSIWHTCYADRRNQMTINPRGKIYKCTACDFSERHTEGVLSTTGEIRWNSLHEKRMQASPLKVTACRDCSILPICAGGCSQRILECTNQNECPLGMSADDKQQYAYRVLAEKLEEL